MSEPEPMDLETFRARYGKRGKKAPAKPKKPSTMTTRRKGGKALPWSASCPASCEVGWQLYRAFVDASRALAKHREECHAGDERRKCDDL